MPVKWLLDQLALAHPSAACALTWRNPFELLISTILSAQCTDERVNKVTPGLFARFPTPERMAAAERSEIEALIHSCGFYRAKAKSLQGSASLIVERFAGQVPRSMPELLTLPGVARKTAAVVLGNAFGILEGIAVDTHVFRLAHRMGLSQGKSPTQVEKELMAIVPRPEWLLLNHRMIEHGRKVCTARRPRCSSCPLTERCPRVGVSDFS